MQCHLILIVGILSMYLYASIVCAKSTTIGQEQQEACADCHPKHVAGFLKTGMGKALYPPKHAKIIEHFPASGVAEVIHPITKVIYQAWIDQEGRWWQGEKSADGSYQKNVEVNYIIGSGNHTRSYLSDIHGEIYELPLTWYTHRKMWDMSPGYHKRNHFRFSRPIKANCLFCHNDLTPMRMDRMNAFKGPLAHGISCIRCHGDGAAHIEARYNGENPSKDQIDPTILNPAHLSPQRQLQICQQCHLAGEARSLLPGRRWDEYDPRTPLQDYMLIYGYDDQAEVLKVSGQDHSNKVHKGRSDFGIASHGERLNLSACAQGKKVLTCSTCHNPHQPQSDQAYTQACLGCHTQKSCGREHQSNIGVESLHHGERTKSRADSQVKSKAEPVHCSQCHMRKGGTSDIPHVNFTDHWIRKRPENTPKSSQGVWPLKSLLPELDPKYVAYASGLKAIAYSQILRFQNRPEYTQITIEGLVRASQNYKNWSTIWKVLAEVMVWTGYLKDAQIAYFEYAKLQENDWNTRVDEAIILKRLKLLDQAEYVLREVVSNDATHLRAWGELATLLQLKQQWEASEEIYQQLDQIAPDMSSTAFNQAYIALLKRDVTKAKYWIEQGIKRDGIGRDAPFYQSSLAMLQGKTAKAISYLDEALRRDPQFTQALSLRAGLMSKEKRWDEAIRDFKMLIIHNPNHAKTYIAISKAYQEKGSLYEALDTLQQAQKRLPKNPLINQALQTLITHLPSPQRINISTP